MTTFTEVKAVTVICPACESGKIVQQGEQRYRVSNL